MYESEVLYRPFFYTFLYRYFNDKEVKYRSAGFKNQYHHIANKTETTVNREMEPHVKCLILETFNMEIDYMSLIKLRTISLITLQK